MERLSEVLSTLDNQGFPTEEQWGGLSVEEQKTASRFQLVNARETLIHARNELVTIFGHFQYPRLAEVPGILEIEEYPEFIIKSHAWIDAAQTWTRENWESGIFAGMPKLPVVEKPKGVPRYDAAMRLELKNE